LLFVGGGVSVFVSVEAGGAVGAVVDAFAFNSFLQLARNLIRSGPWRPFASACFEHSMDSGDRTVGVFVFVAARAAVAAAIMVTAAKVIGRDFIDLLLTV
jgi:hypothetical protein